jgi:putative PIN family toxin of toxin-antitoxin system
MRVVADTNVVVSGLRWHGPSRSVLEATRSGTIKLFTSAVFLCELEDVLSREKFAARIAGVGLTPRELTMGYAALASLTKPVPIQPVIPDDPDDDFVLACALAANAEIIVSGDSHLRKLGKYKGINILSAVELLSRITTAPGSKESEKL